MDDERRSVSGFRRRRLIADLILDNVTLFVAIRTVVQLVLWSFLLYIGF